MTVASSSKGEPEAFEENASTPSGMRVFLSTKAPRRDGEGRTIGLVGISRDITERKRTEEQLRLQAAALQAAANAIVITKRDGAILLVDPCF